MKRVTLAALLGVLAVAHAHGWLQPQQHRGGQPRQRGRQGEGDGHRRRHLEVRAGDEPRSDEPPDPLEARARVHEEGSVGQGRHDLREGREARAEVRDLLLPARPRAGASGGEGARRAGPTRRRRSRRPSSSTPTSATAITTAPRTSSSPRSSSTWTTRRARSTSTRRRSRRKPDTLAFYGPLAELYLRLNLRRPRPSRS